jgi:hypothetical protein
MTRILLLALLAGCGSEDDRPATWSYIHATIIVPNCTTSGCHSEFTQTYGYNFNSKEVAYETFHGLDTGVLNLLEGKSKTDYRMPPDQPLPQADIDLIARWIADGKQNN